MLQDLIRERIVKEFKRRINIKFNNIIYDGEAGSWGKWTREVPCFHIFELATEQNLVKPGLYQVILPIQLDYVYKVAERNLLFTLGKKMLRDVQFAVELDERFSEFQGTVDKGEDLCIQYFISNTQIVEVIPTTLVAATTYQFVFVDKFLGYESSRH